MIRLCATCERGYRSTLERIRHNGPVRQQHQIDHGHLFVELSDAVQSLRWKTHCDRCHAAGLAAP